jgi:hypothetical protein
MVSRIGSGSGGGGMLRCSLPSSGSIALFAASASFVPSVVQNRLKSE